MKKISALLPVLALSLLFFSCQKELSVDTTGAGGNNGNNNEPATLTGNWNFLHLYMDVSSTATGNVLGSALKSVTAYKTTSVNNTGTLSFTADKFSVANMGYRLLDTAHVSYTGYFNEEEDIPFDFDIEPYSGSGKYQQVGSDSLYFPDGSVFQGLEIDGQEITSSAASGAKYAIKSDTLLIYANVNVTKDTTITDDNTGIRVKFNITQQAITVGSFKKK